VKTITENEAKTYLRKRGRRLEVPDPLSSNEGEEEATLPQADPAPGPEETVAGQEELGKLRHCLQALSSTDQEIFWMRERGYSYQEITGTLGLPLGTAGVKYSRAKEKIAECLKKAGIFGHGRKNEA
jgi:RNA polymerase sigma factor (sigma-70 family)